LGRVATLFLEAGRSRVVARRNLVQPCERRIALAAL
jgi:hypothetical protein